MPVLTELTKSISVFVEIFFVKLQVFVNFRKLKKITLNSIKKLRSFTNDTLLDILFYGSPVYAQVRTSALIIFTLLTLLSY